MIDYLPLKRITAMYAAEVHEAVSRVVDSGWYLRGEYTQQFEQAYAHYVGSRHCVGCGNGLDALTLILRAYIEMGVMKEGDEVIVPANTYIASILAITENRLTPVLVEPSAATLQIDERLIERHISPRTRAVMIVHLYGCCAYTPYIADLCRRYHLKLIEDNAQAHGLRPTPPPSTGADALTAPEPGERHGRRTGALGDAAAHSFYPGKNLGALGDAGAVTTDDDRLAGTVRALGNYGSHEKYVNKYLGRNSRIDELQAAVLLAKLPHLDDDNRRRQQIADYYCQNFSNPYVSLRPADSRQAAHKKMQAPLEKIQAPLEKIQAPLENVQAPLENVQVAPDDGLAARPSVNHIFPVFCARRYELQQYLAAQGIQTLVHYPLPPHRQACYRQWNQLSLPVTELIAARELSIPCHQAMSDSEVEAVVSAINGFGV